MEKKNLIFTISSSLILAVASPAFANELDAGVPQLPLDSASAAHDLGYRPSRYATMDEARQIFQQEQLHTCRSFRSADRSMQRAAYWASELQSGPHHVKSMGVILYFTDKFRSTFTRGDSIFWTLDFPQALRSAPFVYVNNSETVLDRVTFNGPRSLDDWTLEMIHEARTWSNSPRLPHDNEIRCRVISNSSEVENPDPSDWCLIRKVPMYYFDAGAMRDLDLRGDRADHFSEAYIDRVLNQLDLD